MYEFRVEGGRVVLEVDRRLVHTLDFVDKKLTTRDRIVIYTMGICSIVFVLSVITMGLVNLLLLLDVRRVGGIPLDLIFFGALALVVVLVVIYSRLLRMYDENIVPLLTREVMSSCHLRVGESVIIYAPERVRVERDDKRIRVVFENSKIMRNDDVLDLSYL